VIGWLSGIERASIFCMILSASEDRVGDGRFEALVKACFESGVLLCQQNARSNQDGSLPALIGLQRV
jgi:hypothetical protein